MEDIGPLSTKDSILDYLGGYVAKKFSTLDCAGCVETMLSATRQPSNLIQTKSRGYLKVPSSRLLALLKIVEEHVETYTVQKIACGDVYVRIVEGILLDSRTASASVGCVSHFLGTTAEVVHFFLDVDYISSREKKTKPRGQLCEVHALQVGGGSHSVKHNGCVCVYKYVFAVYVYVAIDNSAM